ncbi:MAG: hypothetical protein OXD32_00770, partial [Endozoicomonadaceae bacterium]|nr:hypothetical protein [Endozoicomonadaceae bacterium]
RVKNICNLFFYTIIKTHRYDICFLKASEELAIYYYYTDIILVCTLFISFYDMTEFLVENR